MSTQTPEGLAGAPPGPAAAAPPGGGTPPPVGSARYTSTGAPFAPAAAPPPAGAPPPAPAPRREPEIPPEPLRDRLKRAATSASNTERLKWSKALGTDDPAKIAERLKKLADLEAADAERERANLTELQKLQAERETEKARADSLQAQLSEAQETAAYQRQDQQLRELASEVIDPKAVRFARHEWANHVVSLSPDEQEKLTPRDARKWFTAFAKENPQFAKADPGAAPPPAAAAPPAARPGAPPARRPTPPVGAPRRPATNGAPPPRREPAAPANASADPSTDAGKTARPGQKNSMSRKELKEFAAKHGVNYPG